MFLRILSFLLLFAGFAIGAPKHLLLVGQGPDGHPPGSHEFMAGVRVVGALLKPFVEDIATTVAKGDEPWQEGPAMIDKADGIVMLVTQGARWMQSDPARHDALKRLAARKGAIVALHWSIGAQDEQYINGQLALLGGTRGGPQRKYRVMENDVRLAEPRHPILHGMNAFRIHDEFYYRLDLIKPSAAFHPLLVTTIDGNEEIIGWAWERPDGGRSFGYVGLHFHSNWERPEYRRLVTQGILWALDLPVPGNGVQADIDPAVLKLSQVPGGNSCSE